MNQMELTVIRRELVRILGATTEALSRGTRKISNAGVLSLDGLPIRIPDREAPGNLAEGNIVP